MGKRKQMYLGEAKRMPAPRGDGRDPGRSTVLVEIAAAVAATDQTSRLPFLLRTFSLAISFVIALLHISPAWGWMAKLLSPQACSARCSGKDTTACCAAGTEEGLAPVGAQFVICDTATDTTQLPPCCEEGKGDNALQGTAVLEQQLHDAQQAAAAADTSAKELAHELRCSQKCAKEARQNTARVEELYQQAKSAGQKAVKAQQQLATDKEQLLQDLQAARQGRAAADARAQQLSTDLASAEQKWLQLQLVCGEATVAAEDALQAHQLLKSREDGMTAELLAANAKAEDLSSALLAAQQQAAEAQERALQAEEQSKQAVADAQQACLAKRKMKEEKQQLAKQLQEEKQQLAQQLQDSKAAQGPQQARLQQMYSELEVARRHLGEGKLRTNRLTETIQQAEAAAQVAATSHMQLQVEKQQLTHEKQQLRQLLDAAQKWNTRKVAKLTVAEAQLAEALAKVAQLEEADAAAAATPAAAVAAVAVHASPACSEQERKRGNMLHQKNKQQVPQQKAKVQDKQKQESVQQEAAAAAATTTAPAAPAVAASTSDPDQASKGHQQQQSGRGSHKVNPHLPVQKFGTQKRQQQQQGATHEAAALKEQLQVLQADKQQLQDELAAVKQQLANSLSVSSSSPPGRWALNQAVALPTDSCRPSDELRCLKQQLDEARSEEELQQARLQQLAAQLRSAEAELAAAAEGPADTRVTQQTCKQELELTQHQVQASMVRLVEAVQGQLEAQQDVEAMRSSSRSNEADDWLVPEAGSLPPLQAAQAALQQQEALIGQASSELSPALMKIVELEQQAKAGCSAAAGQHQQLLRTVARLTAQLKAAAASQLQQQARVSQLTQQLELKHHHQQQQQQARGAAGVQAPAATVEGLRQPTAGSDVQALVLQSAEPFSVHENPTADEDADVTGQLRELQADLAEATRRITHLEGVCKRADNAAVAAYEYQQQLEEHARLLQCEIDAATLQHSQQQARMQQVTDELLRQVTRKLVGVRRQLVGSRPRSVVLKGLCKEVVTSTNKATSQQHKLGSELANTSQQLTVAECRQQDKLQQLPGGR